MANYTNLNALSNISPIDLNFDNLTSINTVGTAVIDTSKSEVGNIWFMGSILLLFLMFIWWFYREDKSFTYDMTRSIFIASSWCFFITTVFVLSDWITTIIPLIWFGNVWVICLIAIRKLKQQGL